MVDRGSLFVVFDLGFSDQKILTVLGAAIGTFRFRADFLRDGLEGPVIHRITPHRKMRGTWYKPVSAVEERVYSNFLVPGLVQKWGGEK
jgi:hypothetical protein